MPQRHARVPRTGPEFRNQSRSLKVSNVYATGTSKWGEMRPRPLRGTPVAALMAALLAASTTPGAASAAVDGATAKVDVQIVARPADVEIGEAFQLRDGGVLRSGDGVQLRIASESRAYVYVIAYGSSHSAILLHPFSGRAEDALVGPDAARVVPGPGVFLPLDGQEGNETILSIVSDAPLEDVSALLARIEEHGDDLEAIMTLMNERYENVRRLTFRHIGMRPLVGLAAVAPRRQSSSSGSFDAALAGIPRSTPGAPSTGEGGWSLPSGGESFDTAASTPAAAAAPAATGSADESASAPPVPARDAGAVESAPDGKASAGKVSEGKASEGKASEDVSPALRRAREAAGIDEQQFRGILAKLPASGTGDAPEAVVRDAKEEGVLSAEGSRIRALDSVQVNSRDGYPSSEGSESSNQ